VAFAVGRPVGNAVARNLVKRRLRAAVTALDAATETDPESGMTGGAWLFRARRDAADRPYARLRDDVEHAVQAARRR
jgi:ribonuclease P protein component